MTILADHRERRSGVPDALKAIGVHVEETSLALADFVVAPGIGVERKSIGDFHRSIADGRLWSQAASLRVDLDTAYLVIEGDDLDRGPISRGGVRGALLELIDLGVPVLRSKNADDTAEWLVRIASRSSRRGAPRRPSRSSRRRPITAEIMLAAVPGISPRIAAELLERFGSIEGVATAPESDLVLVRGIGPRRVTSLRRLLSERS